MNSILEPTNKEKLAVTLRHHVVSVKITAADVVKSLEEGNGKVGLSTLNGGSLTAVSKGGGFFLMDANGNFNIIGKTDVMASNSVIQDAVLKAIKV